MFYNQLCIIERRPERCDNAVDANQGENRAFLNFFFFHRREFFFPLYRICVPQNAITKLTQPCIVCIVSKEILVFFERDRSSLESIHTQTQSQVIFFGQAVLGAAHNVICSCECFNYICTVFNSAIPLRHRHAACVGRFDSV